MDNDVVNELVVDSLTELDLLQILAERLDMIYTLQLFLLTCLVGVFVCYVLYKAFKILM